MNNTLFRVPQCGLVNFHNYSCSETLSNDSSRSKIGHVAKNSFKFNIKPILWILECTQGPKDTMKKYRMLIKVSNLSKARKEESTLPKGFQGPKSHPKVVTPRQKILDLDKSLSKFIQIYKIIGFQGLGEFLMVSPRLKYEKLIKYYKKKTRLT